MVSINEKIIFNYVGGMQSWTVPKNVKKIKIEVNGAQGGTKSSAVVTEGGKGGKTYGELTVVAGQRLYIYVGGKGSMPTGGYNGGGNGGNGSEAGAGGGGATDVRLGGTTIDHRIIVGGGGGGATYARTGGNGGGLKGSNGEGTYGGGGGTQTEGGTGTPNTNQNATVKGTGGAGAHNASSSEYSGGGGGGGYYGGAGGFVGTSGWAGAGGGGSSYYGILENAGTTAGSNSGHGNATITILEMDYLEITEHSSNNGLVTSIGNIFSYSIAGNVPLSTVTETINGIIVATKTASYGEILEIRLTEEQWNAVPYGKYQNVEGVKNTIVINAGDFSWTYHFEKSLDSNSSMIDISNAMKSANDIHMPYMKKKLASKINGNALNTFENLIEGITISNLGGKKWASGVSVTNITTMNMRYSTTVSGIPFTPSLVAIYTNNSSNNDRAGYALYTKGFGTVVDIQKSDYGSTDSGMEVGFYNTPTNSFTYTVSAKGFTPGNTSVYWIAIE